MKVIHLFIISMLLLILTSCGSRGITPSASNCYGNGQPGCEQYWEGGKPKSITIDPPIDDQFIKKFKIPSKEKYINRSEVGVFRKWSKSGTSRLEKEKALLECGSGDYFDDRGYQFMKVRSLEEYNSGLIKIHRCMLNDGFTYLGSFSLCDANDPPIACSTSAPIRTIQTRIDGKYCINNPSVKECQPQPVERILNSERCRKYPDAYYCQPDWYSIDTCTRFPKSDDCQPETESVQIEPDQPGTDSTSQSSANPKQSVSANRPTQVTTQLAPKAAATTAREYPARSLKLQQDMQRDSNRQMNQLLRNTAPKNVR
ncbi:hypothetical protein [Oxalicibacterium faecigallinarum]|uniref:Lipoprotein n=1 Tax=Oxalicibacterium faecigallinarum TaxID=573741 RepID=A0A8J3AZU0_9BURK|nr:hypothetical protein [Oxalicibacterium faecigallinarum]GGI20438.1 hypothetical protein GCM10008066_24030 [Oxalicibacterium faecigallinarum]